MASAVLQDKSAAGPKLVDQFRKLMAKRIEETGIPMTELAEKSKVGRTYLYRILSGEHTPSMAIAERIAAVLGIKITISKKT